MFHGHLDYFQKPLLEGRPNTKLGDHGTPNAHNTSRKHGKKEPQSFSHCGSFDHCFPGFFLLWLISNFESLSLHPPTAFAFLRQI